MKLSNKSTTINLQIEPFLTKVYLHQIFFLFRSVCFGLLALESKTDENLLHPYKYFVEDVVFLSSFSFFTFSYMANAILSHNIFAYNISIILLFHNAFYIFIIEITARHNSWDNHILYAILIIFLYLVEASYTLIIRFINRNDINMFLFKKIGADPAINEALATRKTVQTLSSINVFIPFALALESLATPLFSYSTYDTMTISFIFLNCLSQLLISARFNEENILQRKIALILSVIKILTFIAIKVVQIINKARGLSDRNVEYIASIDILFVSTYMTYYLYKDYKLFGSGLKEILRYGSKRMSLDRNKE